MVHGDVGPQHSKTPLSVPEVASEPSSKAQRSSPRCGGSVELIDCVDEFESDPRAVGVCTGDAAGGCAHGRVDEWSSGRCRSSSVGDRVGSPAVGAGPRKPRLRPAPDVRRRQWRRRQRHDRHLRDLLGGSQRLTLLGLVLSWALCTLWAVLWWLEPGHRISTTGMVFNSLLVGIEFVVLPIYLYWWLWRVRGPDPALGVPRLRTAMIVTKAPSEPWAVVRVTLEAMLSQDFPHPYDVWLADELVEPATRAWCRQQGVRICTRDGVTAYHRPSWPRRTRCKEGNLAFFYEIWGYRLYDVVAQLDADHVPAPEYLRRMVIPFVDELVGYVAAPSICDRNAARSWSARARLYAEAVLHGPMQAGHSGGFAPSCIGSHYAVRTRALKEIGGIGPELAEDFTTTLMMSSHGWQGVFAIDAEAHGDGPECLEDCLTQEFQWSRSMMNVLLSVSGAYWKGLSVRAKLRLGFCQVWYPLFGLLMALSVLLPLAAVLTRTPLMQVGLGDFYLHVAPGMLALVATVLWLRSLDCLRPRAAKAVSWEIVLFQLIRWPWALLGCAHAIAGRIAGREFAFKVTPKGRTGVLPLPAKVVTPYLCLAIVSAAPTLLNLDAGSAHGYKTLALINAGLYLLASVAIVAAHVRDHPLGIRNAALRSIAPKALASAACVTFVLAGLALQTFRERDARPANGIAIDPDPFRLGVTTRSLAENLTTVWKPADLAEVDIFEHTARARWSHPMVRRLGPRQGRHRPATSCRRAREHATDHLGALGRHPRHKPAARLHAGIDHPRAPRHVHPIVGTRPAPLRGTGAAALRARDEHRRLPRNERCHLSVGRSAEWQSTRRVRARLATRSRHLHRRESDQCPLGLVPGSRDHPARPVPRRPLRRHRRAIGLQRRYRVAVGRLANVRRRVRHAATVTASPRTRQARADQRSRHRTRRRQQTAVDQADVRLSRDTRLDPLGLVV